MSIRHLAAAVLVSTLGVGVMGCGAEASDGGDAADESENLPEGEAVGRSEEALTWYKHVRCDSPGGWGEPVCVAWTGGYPDGVVRAESRSTYYYAISLRSCSDSRIACDARTTVASKVLNNHAGYTPSVRAGKYSWYIVCAKRFSSSPWACNRGMNEVYLGD